MANGAPSAGDDDGAAVVAGDGVRDQVLAVALVDVDLPVGPDDPLGQVSGQRADELGFDPSLGVDDQDVFAVGVDDERQLAVVGEGERARARDHVAERAAVAVMDGHRQARELLAGGARTAVAAVGIGAGRAGLDHRQRGKDGALEVEIRLRRVGPQHQVRDPQLRGPRPHDGVVEPAHLAVRLGRILDAAVVDGGRAVGDRPARRERERLRREAS